MIDLTEMCSLTEFQRNAKEHVEQLNRTGRPRVLTVNGKAALVVQDAASYQKLIDEKDRLEAIAGIERGLADLKAGRVRPLRDALKDLERKYEKRTRR